MTRNHGDCREGFELDHRVLKGLSQIGHLGLVMLIPILIGMLGGAWLDQRFQTQPLWIIVGAVVGVAAAFRNLYVWAMKQAASSSKRRVADGGPKKETGKDSGHNE